MAKLGADTDELHAFTTLHLGWDEDLGRLLLGSGRLVDDLLAPPASAHAGAGLRDVLNRLDRVQRQCIEVDGEPGHRAIRFDAASDGTAARRRSRRVGGIRFRYAARRTGTDDVLRYATLAAIDAVAPLMRALRSGDRGEVEEAIRKLWNEFGGKGSTRYKLLFAQALFRRLPPEAVVRITELLDHKATGRLDLKSRELHIWSRMFARATRAKGGIGPRLRNVLIRRARDGTFAHADVVVLLTCFYPEQVSGPWRGIAAAISLGDEGRGLGGNERIMVSLLRNNAAAQRWFWLWGERFGTITAGNANDFYIRKIIAGQMSRHSKEVVNALDVGTRQGARYGALIKEIVAAGEAGRTRLLKVGGGLIRELEASVREFPEEEKGWVSMKRAGAFWHWVIAGFAENDEKSNRVRGLLAETIGSIGSSFGPPGVQIVTGLVLTPALKALFGSSREADKRKAEVLAAVYPSILKGILASSTGARFRRVHPELFRDGRVVGLNATLKVLSSVNVGDGGPSEAVRFAADKKLRNFLASMGGD